MSCQISLFNYSGCYRAGETITGVVEAHFNVQKTIKGVKIRLKCVESTSWEESSSTYNSTTKTDETTTTNYSGHNELLRNEIWLYRDSHIGPGSFKWPFSFNLPQNLPSSYKGIYGKIEYLLKATVDRNYRFLYESKANIVVFSPVYLHALSPYFDEPHQTAAEKTLGFFCCKKGTVKFEMHLPKRGFVVGENICIRVVVTNLSKVNIKNLKFKLVQTNKSKATHPRTEYKCNRVTLAKHTDKGIGAHGEHDFIVQLLVPTDKIIPNFLYAGLFESSYTIEGSCVFDGFHTNLKLEIVPFIGHQKYPQENASQSYIPPCHLQQTNTNQTWITKTETVGDLPPPYEPDPFTQSSNKIGFHEGVTVPSAPYESDMPSVHLSTKY